MSVRPQDQALLQQDGALAWPVEGEHAVARASTAATGTTSYAL